MGSEMCIRDSYIAAAAAAADVGKKEEKNFFALSTYFHGRTQLLHIELENIE